MKQIIINDNCYYDQEIEYLFDIIAQLPKEELFKLTDYLVNMCKFLNKTKADTPFLRYIALRGYNTIGEFKKENNICRDGTINNAILGKGDSIMAMNKLKKILDIDGYVYSRYLEFLDIPGDE